MKVCKERSTAEYVARGVAAFTLSMIAWCIGLWFLATHPLSDSDSIRLLIGAAYGIAGGSFVFLATLRAATT